MKAAELRGKTKQEMLKKLEELKQELQGLRVMQASGSGGAKLGKMCARTHARRAAGPAVADSTRRRRRERSKVVRKSIARALTVINQTRKASLREYYKNAKHIPLDLRKKKTRAIRRRLTKYEASKQTPRQRLRQAHFPQRVYAIRA